MSDQAQETPLIDLLRRVPIELRVSWPTQWGEDGFETGHAMCPIGLHCHKAAERIALLEAENQRLRQALGEIKQIADLSHWCDSVSKIAKTALLGGGE